MQKRNEIIVIVDKVEYQKLMNYISREDPGCIYYGIYESRYPLSAEAVADKMR